MVCVFGIIMLAHKIGEQTGLTEYVQRTEAVFQVETIQMLMGDLLSNILHNALDAALQLLRNGFRQTFVVHQVPAEHGARQCRRGLGRFND